MRNTNEFQTKAAGNRAKRASLHTKFWSIACTVTLIAGMNPAAAYADEIVALDEQDATPAVESVETNTQESTPELVITQEESAVDSDAPADEGTSELESSDRNDTGTWDGSSAVAWTHGSGTAADPYLIESGANFNYLAKMVNTNNQSYAGVYFALTRDLDMSAGNFSGVGIDSYTYFGGHFNGNYHSITVAMIGSTSTEDLGVFNFVNGVDTGSASVEYLVVKGSISVKASINANTGGAVGGARYASISHIRNEASITYTGDSMYTQYIGGVIGSMQYGDVTVDQCSNTGTIIGNEYTYAGGVIGFVESGTTALVSNCYNTGSVSSGYYAGGITGCSRSSNTTNSTKTYHSCYSVGTLSAYYIGGLFGSYPYKSAALKDQNSLTDMFWPQEIRQWYNGEGTGMNTKQHVLTNVTVMTFATMKTRSFTAALNNCDPGTWVRSNSVNNGYPMLAWENPGASDAVTLSNSTVSSVADQTWTGGAITPTVTVSASGETLVEGTDYTVTYANNTNVGTATITITGINGVDGTTTQTFEIVKDVVSNPSAGKNYAYDGTAKTGVTAGTGYTVSGTTTATNAGNYSATATLSDPEHFTWSDGTTEAKTITWSIAKATMNLPTAYTGFTYNGYLKTGVAGGAGYTVTGGQATNAGTYQAVCTITDSVNYMWAETGTATGTVTWSIAKAKVTTPTPRTDLVYDGTRKVAFGDAPAYVMSNYYATEAGTYTATATLLDPTNYAWTDGTSTSKRINWSISRAVVSMPTAVEGLVYNGSEQSAVSAGEGYVLSGDVSATLPGIYCTSVTPDSNHMWANGTTDTIGLDWSIAAKTAVAPTAVEGLVYDGTVKTGVSGGNGYTLSSTTSAIAPGEYNAYATPKEGYAWADGSTSSLLVTWSIARATVEAPTGITTDYTGSVIQGVVIDEDLEEAYEFSGTTEATAAGVYKCKVSPTKNYQWSDGTTSEIEITWEIVETVQYSFDIHREINKIYVGKDQHFWATYTGYEAASFQWQYSNDGGETWNVWTETPNHTTYVYTPTYERHRNYLLRLQMTTKSGEKVYTDSIDWGFNGVVAVLSNSSMVLLNRNQTFRVTLYNLTGSQRALTYFWYYSIDGGETWQKWGGLKYNKTNPMTLKATETYRYHLMKCVVNLSDGQSLETNVVGWNIARI